MNALENRIQKNKFWNLPYGADNQDKNKMEQHISLNKCGRSPDLGLHFDNQRDT